MPSTILSIALVTVLSAFQVVHAGPLFEKQTIIDPGTHGHVHASCIVECPNGDLRAVWYENGTHLPAPYYDQRKDKSDDVRIGGACKPRGALAWEQPFVMADSFGVSDNNPCMVIDKSRRLWLIYPTLLGVPQNAWGSAIVRYSVSSNYEQPGRPIWLRAYPKTSRRHWHMACNLGGVLPRIARRCVDGRWISVKVSPDPRGLVGSDRSGDPDLQNQL